MNALNYGMISNLARVLDEVEESDVRAVFFMGAGDKAFCAGADISELIGRTIPEEYAGTVSGQQTFARLDDLRVPSIALVDGYAL